jgi:hypothetical protein
MLERIVWHPAETKLVIPADFENRPSP